MVTTVAFDAKTCYIYFNTPPPGRITRNIFGTSRHSRSKFISRTYKDMPPTVRYHQGYHPKGSIYHAEHRCLEHAEACEIARYTAMWSGEELAEHKDAVEDGVPDSSRIVAPSVWSNHPNPSRIMLYRVMCDLDTFVYARKGIWRATEIATCTEIDGDTNWQPPRNKEGVKLYNKSVREFTTQAVKEYNAGEKDAGYSDKGLYRSNSARGYLTINHR